MKRSHVGSANPSRSASLQDKSDALLFLCIGLFPALHIGALWAAGLVIVINATIHARPLWHEGIRLGWEHLAIGQFIALSLLNVLLYPLVEGNRAHYVPLSIEALTVTFLILCLTLFYPNRSGGLARAAVRWLPIGLLLSFGIITAFYLEGSQGARVRAFSPNPILPPVWYLALTVACFAGFRTFTRNAMFLHSLLLVSGALVAVYSGSRMALIVWMLSAGLICYAYLLRPRMATSLRAISLTGVGLFGTLLLVLALDQLTSGEMLFRLVYTLEHVLAGTASSEFFRLEIWTAAWELIKERPLLGHGNVNERILLHEILEREWWFRAHQTYLSYWIGGGLLGLISGLIFQTSICVLLFAPNAKTMRPIVFGLFGVIGLNGTTESIFQSFVAVQFYTLVVLIFARAAFAPDHK